MKKNNLDEMQEQKLLKIEHTGCWIAYWGLVISIIVQGIIGSELTGNIVGELCVLFVLSIYLAVASIRNGIWDRKFKPTLKTNLSLSLLAGSAAGLVRFIISYQTYHKLVGSIATFVFVMLFTFILCLVMLSLSTLFYKKRKKTLENESDRDEADI